MCTLCIRTPVMEKLAVKGKPGQDPQSVVSNSNLGEFQGHHCVISSTRTEILHGDKPIPHHADIVPFDC